MTEKPCHHGCGKMIEDDPYARLLHAVMGDCPVLEAEMAEDDDNQH